jgi:hypothetical protein
VGNKGRITKAKSKRTNKDRINERIEYLITTRDAISPEDRSRDDGYSYMRIQAKIEELEDLKGRITG